MCYKFRLDNKPTLDTSVSKIWVQETKTNRFKGSLWVIAGAIAVAITSLALSAVLGKNFHGKLAWINTMGKALKLPGAATLLGVSILPMGYGAYLIWPKRVIKSSIPIKSLHDANLETIPITCIVMSRNKDAGFDNGQRQRKYNERYVRHLANNEVRLVLLCYTSMRTRTKVIEGKTPTIGTTFPAREFLSTGLFVRRKSRICEESR